jgi:protein required for attachment to host cells
MTAWIVVADTSRARVIIPSRDRKTLKIAFEYANADGRAKGAELKSDKSGRVCNSAARRGAPALQAHTAPHEVEAERFASVLAIRLRRAHVARRFDCLGLVAPPHFLGLLRERVRRRIPSCPVTSAAGNLAGFELRRLRAPLADMVKALAAGSVTRSG